MKQILTTLLLLASLAGFCKSKKTTTLPYDSVNNRFILDTVLIAEGLSKDKIHSLVNEWIALNYRSANDVIQMNDKEAGTIIAKGTYPNILWGPVIGGTMNVVHTLTIKIKDGRIKITIENLKEQIQNRPLEEMLTPKQGMYWFTTRQRAYFESNLNIKLYATIEGINNFITTSKSKNDW